MGTFRVVAEIGDPTGQRYETLEVLVDTGASYSVVPAPLLRRLGVTPHTRVPLLFANGKHDEWELGRTWVRVDGRTELTLVIFGPEEAQPVLGTHTLEGLLLAPDPVNRRLVPVPGLLMGDTLAHAHFPAARITSKPA